MSITKRCGVCGRFRAYDEGDEFCVVCGHQELERQCRCGRDYAYALAEAGDVHCPRCGRVLRGRNRDYE
jgi:hypothetical protein